MGAGKRPTIAVIQLGPGGDTVRMIREQISATLKQFPTGHEVRIAIEGQTDGVLEP